MITGLFYRRVYYLLLAPLFLLHVFAILIVVNLLLSYVLRDSRQVSISATSSIVELDMHAVRASQWRFNDSAKLYAGTDVLELDNVHLDFSAGGMVQIRKIKRDVLRISFVDGPLDRILADSLSDRNVELEYDDFLEISTASNENSGILSFYAKLQVGAAPSSGTRDLFQTGKYWIAESLPYRIVGPTNPVVYSSGSLSHGDLVSIVSLSSCNNPSEGDPRAVTTGYLDITSDYIFVNAVSIRGDSALRVNRMGNLVTCSVPGWFDIATKDPYLIALAALLTLIMAISSLGSQLSRQILQ